jgi:transcriptional antiterminator RfaH
MISAVFDIGQVAPSAWFCVRSRPKREHIAASYLREKIGIEVYLPRVRFKRPTLRGPKWFEEALFPTYLFARFNLLECFRQVHHGHGARGIVHFGKHWPTVPEALISELRQTIPDDLPHVLHEEFRPGEAVIICGGPLHQLEALVTRVMPGKMRVAVLLEFLGRQTMVELDPADLLKADESRPRVV